MVGTPGYLRIPEAYEMAEELEEYWDIGWKSF